MNAPNSKPISGSASPASKLAIIAGRGRLPLEIRAACERQGRPFFVVVLAGCGEACSQGLPSEQFMTIRMDQAGAAVKRCQAEGVQQLVMAGGVDRPSVWSLRPDWETLKFVWRVGWRLGGEDSLLGAIRDTLEEKGFRLVGAHQLAQGLLAEPRAYARKQPSHKDREDIAQAWRIAKTLGGLDAGQGAVVQRSFVLAIEAIEGTDAMIARAGSLKRKGGGGVLVKVAKPQQDHRLDLPTIGPQTIENLAAAGLKGLVIEAGAALVLDEMRLGQLADQHGLFVLGMTQEQVL